MVPVGKQTAQLQVNALECNQEKVSHVLCAMFSHVSLLFHFMKAKGLPPAKCQHM